MRKLLQLSRTSVFALLMLAFFGISSSKAATTTFISESFSNYSFFPAGWSGNVAPYSSYNYGGWFRSSAGMGGYNGAAVADAFFTYGYGSYNGTTMDMITPGVDVSGYGSADDSVLVDFDLFMPRGNYGKYYGGKTTLTIYSDDGNGNLTQLKQLNSITDYTYDYNGYSTFTSPNTSAANWKHFRLNVDIAARTANMKIVFHLKAENTYGYYYYTYAEDPAIDNVSIIGGHYFNIAYAPKAIDFKNLGVGLSSNPVYVTFSNPNPAQIDLSNFTFIGTEAGDFSISRNLTSLAPGTKANPSVDSIGIVFSPGAKGLRAASLTFNSTADNALTGKIDLLGFGLVPTIALNTQGSLFLKTRTKFDQSLEQSVIIHNTGGSPLIISNKTSITGDYPDQYMISRIPTAYIMPDQFDTLTVRYTPTIEGGRPADLNIVSNADNGTQLIRLRGVGVLPRFTFGTPSLTFDSVRLGQSVTKSFRIYNPGSDTLVIRKNYFSSGDGDFVFEPLMGDAIRIPPETFVDIPVTFTPLQNGSRFATIRFATNIPLTFESVRRDTGNFEFTISGVGMPFGNLVAVKGESDTSSIVGHEICRVDTVFNTGTAPLTITRIALQGANAAEFKITTVQLPYVLNVGSSVKVSVCGTPAERGMRSAEIAVTGTSEGQQISGTLPIVVYGLQPCAASAPSALFPNKNVLVSQDDSAVVTVTNCGDLSTTYTAALSNTTEYSIVGSNVSAVIPPGGSADFAVKFKPTLIGSANATLTITGDNSAPDMVVALSGIGGGAVIAGTGNAPATAVNDCQEFTVNLSNSGNVDWMPGTPVVAGPFKFVSGNMITAGGSGTMTFQFCPERAGSQSGTVTFPNASPVEMPAFTLNLSGMGVASSVATTSMQGFELGQNYPNPAANAAEINFTLPSSSSVTLVLTDTKGTVVKQIANGHFGPGAQSISVDTRELPSGTYFYALISGSVKLTRQMIVTK